MAITGHYLPLLAINGQYLPFLAISSFGIRLWGSVRSFPGGQGPQILEKTRFWEGSIFSPFAPKGCPNASSVRNIPEQKHALKTRRNLSNRVPTRCLKTRKMAPRATTKSFQISLRSTRVPGGCPERLQGYPPPGRKRRPKVTPGRQKRINLNKDSAKNT